MRASQVFGDVSGFVVAAARPVLGGALICLAMSNAVLAAPTLSTAVFPNDSGYYSAEAAFLSRPDVTQVDFRYIAGETWDTSNIFSTRFWTDTKRNLGSVGSITFADGVTLSGIIQIQGLGHVGQTLPYQTDITWLPAAPLPGIDPQMQLLTLTFADPIGELSLHLSDFGDTANYNLLHATNGLTLVDLHIEALLDGVSVFSQLAFEAIADNNRQGRSLFLDGMGDSFDEVRLTYGGEFPDGDLFDVALIDAIAFAPTEIPEAPSLSLLIMALGLMALLGGPCRLTRGTQSVHPRWLQADQS